MSAISLFNRGLEYSSQVWELEGAIKGLDRLVQIVGSGVFAGLAFFISIPNISKAYKIRQFQKELSQVGIAQKNLIERVDQKARFIQSKFKDKENAQFLKKLSESSKKFIHEIGLLHDPKATYEAEVALHHLNQSLTRDVFHHALDFGAGIAGALVFSSLWITSTLLISIVSPVGAALFWGVWVVSEVDKVVQAFQFNSPDRYFLLFKFIAICLTLAALSAAPLILPLGWTSLLMLALLGLIYVGLEYKPQCLANQFLVKA